MPSPKRTRLYLVDGSAPPGHLPIPRGSQDRALRDWRLALMRGFSKRNGRCLAVAWSLEWRMKKEGFAFCGNDSIAKETNLHVTAVERALTDLEDQGFIMRAYAGIKRRRIYPAIPAKCAGDDTRDASGSTTRDDLGERPALNAGKMPAVTAGHKIDLEGAASAAPYQKTEEEEWDAIFGDDVDNSEVDNFGDEETEASDQEYNWDPDEPIPF